MASLPTNSSHYTDTTEGNNWYAILIQSSLYALLVLVAIIGNGLVIFFFTRHKTLRNLPNYLIVDLSIVDLLNSVVNTPLSICYVVLNDPVYRGKTFAWTVSFLHSLFGLLSLTTMALQMIDRYLAVCWPVFYMANKSKTKLLVIILIKWAFNISLTGLVYFPLYKIDLGSAPVVAYRDFYSRTLFTFFIRIVVFVCIISIIVFAVLALKRLRQPAQVLPAAAQNANSPMARIRRKALYTILIVTFMCVASYLPMIIRSVVGFGFENYGKQVHFAVFAVMICLAIPSALNPFVYLNRVGDFALKVKELKASLFGHRQEENQHSLEQTEQRYTLGEDHIADDEWQKTEEQRVREAELIEQLVSVVNKRDQLVQFEDSQLQQAEKDALHVQKVIDNARIPKDRSECVLQ
ncbi:hypothetical protein ACROYT_G003483 [Oculina patagonica]